MAYLTTHYSLVPGATQYANSTSYVNVLTGYAHSIILDLSKFEGTPEVYLVVRGRALTGNNSKVALFDMGTDDTPVSTAGSQVAGSEIEFTSTGDAWKESGDIAANITNGNRYKLGLENVTSASTTVIVFDAYIMVRGVAAVAEGFTKHESTVTMIGGSFSTTYTDYTIYGGGGQWQTMYLHETGALSGTTTVYLEAVLRSANAGATAYCDLYDVTAGAQVANSELSQTGTVYTRKRTAALTLVDGHEYYVRFKTSDAAYAFTVSSARLIINQAAASGENLWKVRSYYDVRARATTTSSTYQESYKYAKYDDDQYSTISAVYHEACGHLSAAGNGYIDLYGNGATLADSEVGFTATSIDRVRSAALSPTDERLYECRYKSDGTRTFYMSSSMFIIDTKVQRITVVTDALAISENIVKTSLVVIKTVTDTIALGETILIAMRRKFATDAMSLTDLLSVPLRRKTATDALALAESILGHKNLSVTDVLSLTDLVILMTSAASTVATHDDDDMGFDVNQHPMFHAAGRFWVFYCDTNANNLVWKTSTDGSSWSEATTVRACTRAKGSSIWFDGTYVHTVILDYATTMYYRRGTPGSDGNITWSAVEQEVTITEAGDLPIIVVTTEGKPVVFYRSGNGGVYDYNPAVIMSDDTDGTWSTTTDFPHILNTSESNYNWQGTVVPMTSGKFMCIYASNNTTRILGTEWNGSSFEAEENCAIAGATYGFSICVINEGDVIHMVWNKRVHYDLLYNKRAADRTWDVADTTIEADSTYWDGPAISIDTESGDLYVLWSNAPTDDNIYYRIYDKGTTTWAARDVLISESGIQDWGKTPLSAKNYDGKLQVCWVISNGANFDLRHSYFSVGVLAQTVTDSITLTDVIRRHKAISVTDALAIAEAILRGKQFSVTDVIALTDAILRGKSIIIAEGIHLGSEPPSSTGLVAYYDMETISAGKLADLSGNGNDGTVSGGAAIGGVGGIIGGATDFDGVNDYVSALDPSTELGQVITLVAWVYPHTQNNYRGVMGEHGGAHQGIVGFQYENGVWNLGYGNGSAWPGNGQLTLNLNGWTHVVGVIQAGAGGNINVFKNGVQVGSPVSVSTNISHLTTFNIGRAFNSAERYFDGIIDEVRIYNRALSSAEIKQLYDETALVHKNLNETDSIAVSEALYRDKAFPITDALSLVDAIIRGKMTYATDSIGLTDNVIVPLRRKFATDSFALTDVPSIPLRRKIATDSMALSDLVSVPLRRKFATETLSMSDAIAIALRRKIATDSLTLAEALKATKSLIAMDSFALSEAVSRGKSFIITDSLSLAETVYTMLKRLIATDGIALADDVRRDKTLPITDTLSLSDAVYRGKSLTVTDSLGLTEAILALKNLKVTDALAFDDAVSVPLRRKFITDSFALSDAIYRHKAVEVTDAVSLSELVLRGKILTVTDVISLADAVYFGKSLLVTDAIALADDVSIPLRRKFATDSVSLVDDAYRGKTLSITDSFGLADAVGADKNLKMIDAIVLGEALVMAKNLIATDSLALSDLAYRGKAITIAESLAIAEAIVATKTLIATDSIALTDAILRHKSIPIADSLSLLDSIVRNKSLTIADSLTLSDAIYRGKDIRMTEALTVSDALLVNKALKVTDAVSLADALIRGKLLAVTDALSLADSILSDRGLYVTDGVSLSDALALAKNLIATDALTLDDSIAIILRRKFVTDTLSLLETVYNNKSLTLEESIALSEEILRGRVFSVTDSISLSDDVQMILRRKIAEDSLALLDDMKADKALLATDSIALSDSVLMALRRKIVADSLALADGIYAHKSLIASDSLSLIETISQGKDIIVADILSIADDLLRHKSIPITDALSLVDSILSDRRMVLADTLALTDNILLDKLTSASDSIGLSDDVRAHKGLLVTDEIYLTDSAYIGHIIEVADSLSFVDSSLAHKILQVIDSLDLGEEALRHLTAIVQEDLTLTEDILRNKSLTITDVVGILDGVLSGKAMAVVDSLLLTDAMKIDKDIPIADLITLTDVALTPSKLMVLQELLALSENILVDKSLLLTDLLALLDEIDVFKGMVHYITDSIALSESLKVDKATIITDSLNLIDAVLKHMTTSVVESISFSDTALLHKSMAIQDFVGTLDDVKTDKALLLGELLTLTDEFGIDKMFYLDELIGVSDSLFVDKSLNILEALGFSEDLFTDKALIADDVIGLVDDLLFTLMKLVTDSIALTDGLLVDKTMFMDDLLSLQDDILVDKLLFIEDDITVTEDILKIRLVIVIDALCSRTKKKNTGDWPPRYYTDALGNTFGDKVS